MRLHSFAASLALALSAPAFGKLPALSDEAKAKAAENATKAAWTDKVGLYKLCLSQDRVVEHYRAALKTSGKEPPAPVAVGSCNDPGPYATPVTPTVEKGLENAEAHSRPGTAIAPPSVNPTAKELLGPSKK